MGQPKAFGLPKNARLRVSSDFRRVQGRGRKVRTRNLLVLYSRGRESQSRFGLVVSKKVGNAVARNRVKRWLREAIRHNRHHVKGRWDVAVIASPRAVDAGLDVLTQDLCYAIGRLGQAPKNRGKKPGSRA